jgi:hypothetical protein
MNEATTTLTRAGPAAGKLDKIQGNALAQTRFANGAPPSGSYLGQHNKCNKAVCKCAVCSRFLAASDHARA